ncbi:Glyoxylate/hydroxypyruvate reductase HPR3, partial [Linum perenne]
VIVTTGAGLNHLDLPECRRRGIKIAYIVDVFSADGADYAIGLLIDVLRRISGGDRCEEWVLGVQRGLSSTAPTYHHQTVDSSSSSFTRSAAAAVIDGGGSRRQRELKTEGVGGGGNQWRRESVAAAGIGGVRIVENFL